MKDKEKISEITEKLTSYNPGLDNRDDLIRNVMESSSATKMPFKVGRLLDFLFGWTDILWIRRGLVTLSVALVFVFVFQQFSIFNRIGQLENRMVESNTEQIIRQQGEQVLLNSVLMQEIRETEFSDSVMVADKDLRELINSYSELQSRYHDLKSELYSQQFSGKNKNQEL